MTQHVVGLGEESKHHFVVSFVAKEVIVFSREPNDQHLDTEDLGSS